MAALASGGALDATLATALAAGYFSFPKGALLAFPLGAAAAAKAVEVAPPLLRQLAAICFVSLRNQRRVLPVGVLVCRS